MKYAPAARDMDPATRRRSVQAALLAASLLAITGCGGGQSRQGLADAGNVDTGTPMRDDGGLDGSSPEGGSVPVDGAVEDGGTGTIASLGALDFGLAACGGEAPASQTLTLENPSAAALTFTATLSSTEAFALSGATKGVLSGEIAVGERRVLTLSARAVGQDAIAGQPIDATLTVTTNLAAPNGEIVIPVRVVPQGATLRAKPARPTWTLAPRGQSTPLTLALENVGNAPAEVTLTQPDATEFAVRLGSSLAGSFQVPAGSSAKPGSTELVAAFTPSLVGSFSANAALSVGGAVCNGGTPSLTALSLQGSSTGTGFSATPSDALEEYVNCGATGDGLPATTVTVRNDRVAPLTVRASLKAGGGSSFDLDSAEATLAPGGSAQLHVRLKESAVGTEPGVELADTLVLTPAAGSGLSAIELALRTVVQGARLGFGSALPFNGATYPGSQQQNLVVYNWGNLPVTAKLELTGGDGDLFRIVSGPTPGTLPKGAPGTRPIPAQAAFTARFTPPLADVTVKSVGVRIETAPSDIHCGELPSPLVLTGRGSTAVFRLDTPASGTLKFGDDGYVDCPRGDWTSTPQTLAPASPRDVTFTNTGSRTLSWTAELSNGKFALVPSSGTLSPNASGAITVTPQPVAFPADPTFNAHGASLTIRTNIAEQEPIVIPLEQTARGAVLEATALARGFGGINIAFTSPNLPAFSVLNTGNASARVTLDSRVTADEGGTTAAYTIHGATATVGNDASSALTLELNQPTQVEAIFTPGSDRVSSRVSSAISTPDPLCALAPTPVVLTGSGTDADVTLSGIPESGPLELGTARCDAPAGALSSLVLTNYGGQDLTLELGLAADSPFRAFVGAQDVSSVVVPAASAGTPGTAVISVGPKSVSAEAADGTVLSDNLTIETSVGGVSRPDAVVALRATVDCQ